MTSNSDLYKIPVAGALHLLTSVNGNNATSRENSGGSKVRMLDIASYTENNRELERIGMSSNCSNSSNSSNGSFNHTGEIIVVEETVRKREMRLLKNR